MDRPDWKGALERGVRARARAPGRTARASGRARADLAQLRAALGGPLPDAPAAGRRGDRGARGGGRARAGRDRQRPVLRLRVRRRDARPRSPPTGSPRLGPERRPVRARARPRPRSRRSPAAWLLDLLGLPADASVGFVTGAQMANFTALGGRPARGAAPRRLGRRDRRPCRARRRSGSSPAPSRHDTIDRALRFLGIGTDAIVAVEADDQGRMRADALAAALDERAGPAIVCAQAGNVNSGAFDPIGEICDLAHAAGAWVHVDGAFGLWAAASPACGRCWPASSGPTPGRPTRTSGSTSRTTPGWSSAPTRRPTGPRWASAPRI